MILSRRLLIPVAAAFIIAVFCTAGASVRIIGLSPSISRGGSAVVIFEAPEPDTAPMAGPNILVNDEKVIIPSTFIKKDFFIALIPWRITDKRFKAEILIHDNSGLTETNAIPFVIKKAYYRENKIHMDGDFDLDKKFTELGIEKPAHKLSSIEQYDSIIAYFEKKRVLNTEEAATSNSAPLVSDFFLNVFSPLNNWRMTSPFGEHRSFILNKKTVRESYHYGIDMVSSTNGGIFASNGGKAVFTGYNGAEGNMVLIDHSLGLYTLYCHMSEIYVKKDAEIISGEIIGVTGDTGYALGEHLHFSVIIQGVFVSPAEWMNAGWVNSNILDVVRKSAAMVNSAAGIKADYSSAK
ncbi:MAG: M23 family metallopeptidase [Brevinematales bacterium]|jgi:murein DD-endopeptidase MepM/ murein hydrolase activator NlpD